MLCKLYLFISLSITTPIVNSGLVQQNHQLKTPQATNNPGITTPGLVNPGLTTPGLVNPGLTTTEVNNTDPGVTTASTTATTPPGVNLTPGLANPGATTLGVTNPGVVNPKPVESVNYDNLNESKPFVQPKPTVYEMVDDDKPVEAKTGFLQDDKPVVKKGGSKPGGFDDFLVDKTGPGGVSGSAVPGVKPGVDPGGLEGLFKPLVAAGGGEVVGENSTQEEMVEEDLFANQTRKIFIYFLFLARNLNFYFQFIFFTERGKLISYLFWRKLY